MLDEIVQTLGKTPYYQDDTVAIYHGDCRTILTYLAGISAVVTDCPYELGFMGKKWDNQGISFQLDTWRLIREACLPGAMLLSFGGTRTSHRIACAIEDAGWQIRDTICWVYGSGFPKSLDISKAIDKVKGVKFDSKPASGVGFMKPDSEDWHQTKNQLTRNGESTPEAKLWEGYGTALKPAYEPILVCMNPLDGTFADNALKHKVAGLNIDECRVEYQSEQDKTNALAGDAFKRKDTSDKGWSRPWMEDKDKVARINADAKERAQKGRFPSNFIHDGSQEVMELFPQSNRQPKIRFGIGKPYNGLANEGKSFKQKQPQWHDFGDSGSAARFFYCAKASRSERDAGLEDMPDSKGGGMQGTLDQKLLTGSGNIRNNLMKNNHPTVKPLSLMTYLCKLVKMPEYNLILDPFCGSGTTLLACKKLGIPCIGIDSKEEYCEIAAKRCDRR